MFLFCFPVIQVTTGSLSMTGLIFFQRSPPPHQDFNIFVPQSIVKNLERQEVRDWLQNTKDILNEEKKVYNYAIKTFYILESSSYQMAGRLFSKIIRLDDLKHLPTLYIFEYNSTPSSCPFSVVYFFTHNINIKGVTM